MLSTAWSLLMLLAVLACIPLVLLAIRKMQTFQPAGARALEIAAQLPLGARERIVLVRMNERVLVLGVTTQQVTLLAEASAADLPLPAQPPAAFQALLRNVLAGATGRPR